MIVFLPISHYTVAETLKKEQYIQYSNSHGYHTQWQGYSMYYKTPLRVLFGVCINICFRLASRTKAISLIPDKNTGCCSRLQSQHLNFGIDVTSEGKGAILTPPITRNFMHQPLDLSTEPQKKGMLAVLWVSWEVFVIEILDKLLYFETKLLVQDDGWVCGRHVQGHVLPHTSLKHIIKSPKYNVNTSTIS